jgi:opine dehydrogenase
MTEEIFMDVKRVAVIGAGNGGITAAADFKHRGKEVSLYELPKFKKNIDDLKKAGKITVKEPSGEFSIVPDLLTTDISEAIKDAQIILVTIPSFATEEFSRQLAPVATEDQLIIFHGAASMCSLRFLQIAKELGIEKKFKLGDLNTLAYGTRAFPEKGLVELSLRVRQLFFAAIPASETATLIDAARQIYDCIEPAKNIWNVLLTNGNPEAHCACILNAGRIEYSKGEFWYYKEGITPHTINIMLAIDQERIALGNALGFELEEGRQARVKRGYLKDEPNTPYEELFNTSPVFTKIKGPLSVDSRYLVEDISNGLTLYSSLGKALGVPTPVADAIVTLGSTLLKNNFKETGLTLEKLGLKDSTVKQLIDAVN